MIRTCRVEMAQPSGPFGRDHAVIRTCRVEMAQPSGPFGRDHAVIGLAESTCYLSYRAAILF